MGGQKQVREYSSTGPLGSAAGQDLVRELRRMKAASGLSFARLGAETTYSRASLERYINGKLFPSRQAVAEIARACGADPADVQRLWDAAVAAESAAGQPTAPLDRRTAWRRRARLVVAALALTALVLGLDTGAAPGKGSVPSARADGCRDYYAEIRVYTIGRMCWTAEGATVSGYVLNPAEPGPALAQLCVSNRPNSCSQLIDLATAGVGRQVWYQRTVGLAPGYGAWIRTCLSGYCTSWK
ncbi:helix-turn-helix domain-containing protein [Amycolatopsis taiwanensis]|uniref:HTH cro/C1-type domain-containing protein n=1 Tax=Amycolatopsis taiwanensis TaxID=342230 RepID=A0A9W6QWA0_9PSEU|nr:helix-turn-helix transcriptional regulator [Amycolatopsis taiwanensis]GLY64739.1 hypothetical protein Atai01_13580 [Amycolatopsis taiwanensis]